MTLQIGVYRYTCHDAAAMATFWGEVLGREVAPGATAAYAEIETGSGAKWIFVQGDSAEARWFRPDLSAPDLHIDAARLESLGATRVGVFEQDGVNWIDLEDPEGNVFSLVAPPEGSEVERGDEPRRGTAHDDPSDDLAALAWIVGRWRTSGTVFDAEGKAVQQIAGTDGYTWMEGRRWILHEVDVMMGDDRVRSLELIGNHDSETDSFVTRAFDASGAFDMMSASARPDGTWRLEGEGVRTTIQPPDNGGDMTAFWEREQVTGTWIRWMDMRFNPMG